MGARRVQSYLLRRYDWSPRAYKNEKTKTTFVYGVGFGFTFYTRNEDDLKNKNIYVVVSSYIFHHVVDGLDTQTSKSQKVAW